MFEISSGVIVTWQIAAMEAAHGSHQYIEKEHIFIGLCKAGDLLTPEYLEEAGIDSGKIDRFLQEAGLDHEQKNQFRSELGALNELLAGFGLNKTKLRRRLRGMVGQGDYEHKERVIHRSQDCKQVFTRAAELAKTHGFPKIGAFPLLLTILEEPDTPVSKAISEVGANVEDLKQAILERLKEEPKAEPVAVGVPKSEMAKIPYLEKFGRDVTGLAKERRVDPLIGRRDELLQVIRTLTRKTKNNPVLIGEAGVGKTAIVEGLALRIASGNLTQSLQNKRIIELNMGTLVAGTKYRGEFEERLTGIIKEASTHPEIILFIDEIHTVVGAGSAEGSLDASNILKPALSKGEISCIGATTISEYRKYIEKDAALERRFQPIMVDEPTVEATLKILEGLKSRYERHHQITIIPSAIKAAVELSARYLLDRRLPDKAIDLLDEACTRVKVASLSFRGQIGKPLERGNVTEETIGEVLSEWTGLPVKKLTEEDQERLMRMAQILKEQVIGQDEAIEKVAQTVKMARAGLRNPKKPTGVFLFLGPTGVGKTELAKALAEFLFGTQDEMIRLDMSEYMEKHSVSKLIGAPPGYVGYQEEGQLTGKLRRKPYSVVLLDEIEKAHPEIFDLFLQVFDEGRITDSKGRTIDASNAIFIMTSNIGTQLYYKEPIGFVDPNSKNGQTIKQEVQSKIRETFRLEFLNRIDETVFFRPLSIEDLSKIAFRMLDDLRKQLQGQDMFFDIEEGAIELICKEGYDPVYGARPLERTIDRLIKKPLSEKLLTQEFQAGDMILVDAEDGQIVFKKEKVEEDTEGDYTE